MDVWACLNNMTFLMHLKETILRNNNKIIIEKYALLYVPWDPFPTLHSSPTKLGTFCSIFKLGVGSLL